MGYPIPDGPPLYVAAHVDDLIYYSESDLVEEYFEASLSSVLRVEFLGPVSYYLGILFKWSKDEKGMLRVHLFQSAYVLFILDKFGFNMDSVDTKLTPFRSGNPIDALPRDELLPERLIKRYQSIVGSLNWPQISTRPQSCIRAWLHIS